MNSARIIASTVFALGLVAGAAWAASGTTDNAKPAPASTSATTHVMAKAPQHAKAAMPRVDLNSATKEDLMKLSGVDEAVADKIIAARPFKSRSELRTKNLVSHAEYAKLRERVIVKPTAVAATTK